MTLSITASPQSFKQTIPNSRIIPFVLEFLGETRQTGLTLMKGHYPPHPN